MHKKILNLILILVILNLSLKGEDCRKAKEYFEEALKLKYDSVSLFKKEQLYKKAIELCPNYAEAHNNLGDVYEKQGRYADAIAQYKKALECKPNSPLIYFGLGDVYLKTGRMEEAIKLYEEGLRLKPSNKNEEKEFEFTRKMLNLAKNIQKGGIIKAETVKTVLTTTRGPGEIVSINFSEGVGERKGMIPFDFDRYDIREDAKPQLHEIGKALRDIIGVSRTISVEENVPIIEIVGHTDIRGTDEYNLWLSERRAEAIVNYLVKNFNLPREKLIAIGKGERAPICKEGASEKEETPCNALNRRVEIIRKFGDIQTVEGITRTITRGYGGIVESKLVLDVGFFFQRRGERMVEILKEGSKLSSHSDKYFIYFKPLQDCYVYIIQKDSKGKVNILYPRKGRNAFVEKGNDIWVPGFGKSFTLDETKGEETIYLIASSEAIDSPIEGVPLENTLQEAVVSIQTRAIKVVRPSSAQSISSEKIKEDPNQLNALLDRIEGKGGWVKIVRFWHE